VLDYKHLEALAKVASEGGFDKAAQTLNITQSAVSQRVRQLEEHTGQVLLARSSPPRPTAAGKRLIKHYIQVKYLEDELGEILDPEAGGGYVSMPVGLNEDSLSTWFLKAVTPFLKDARVLLDLRADDQEVTHRMLRDGRVIGCVSSWNKPVQGCDMQYLGRMIYKLVCTPGFAEKWFPRGLSQEAAGQAPTLVFNRKDNMNNKFFRRAFGRLPDNIPTCYLPSSEQFLTFIRSGLAYSLVPGMQCDALLESGELVEPAPGMHMPSSLYWHCWSIQSPILKRFGKALVGGARQLLDQGDA
jgi:LysR family transcriptional regulator (chromosome initiation inhibitor)